jgi:hypothetical protein
MIRRPLLPPGPKQLKFAMDGPPCLLLERERRIAIVALLARLLLEATVVAEPEVLDEAP